MNKYSNYYIGDGEEYSMEFIFNFFAHLMKSISRPHIQCDKLAGFVDNQIVSQVQGCQNIFKCFLRVLFPADGAFKMPHSRYTISIVNLKILLSNQLHNSCLMHPENKRS